MEPPFNTVLRFDPSLGLTIQSAKRFMAAQFRDAGLDTPELDARLLLAHATGLSSAEMIAQGLEKLLPEIYDTLGDVMRRRIDGEPVDHILGYREFYGRRFRVTRDVLSPRPETEMLVDAALEIIADKADARLLDLGTGSGAIMVSLLAECPKARGVAVDISQPALDIAAFNAAQYGISDRICFFKGDWFEPVTGQYDIILSNPPYISEGAMADLQLEVSAFDPDIALRGGAQGLDPYEIIIRDIAQYLAPHGTVLFEIGYDQGAAVQGLLEQAGFGAVICAQDLAGHDRMVKATNLL